MNKTKTPYILVVEDSDEDFEALKRVLRTSQSSVQPSAIVSSFARPDVADATISRMVTQAADSALSMAEITIERCIDGDEAMDFLDQKGDYQDRDAAHPPSIILLDLNLPGSDGRDVLQHIKQNDALKMVPVVVLTTSSNPNDIQTCYRYGANSYLIKPMDIRQLRTSISLFLDYWFKAAVLPSAAATQ